MAQPGWLGGLESSALAEALRREPLLYPLVETAHILGFVVLVGAAVMFDLRLLGLSRRLPVVDLARHLLPWARRSLAVVVPTGVLLFLTQATQLGRSPVFALKLALLGLAGLNATLFHLGVFRSVQAWNTGVTAPPAARAAAIVSLLAWTGVITCGRLLAYL
ncbi:hypothetical protein HPC49_35790 [Pyxidicoccus fallax]|uniref:DUF6644 domain-containing protein n=1 Tax=Pyxidicoccus fallax TaxID=394095 RepID=A0A848LUQ1_9BACT|nr:DUF6644 family protein [Pyxidicoccus fallax]NMO21340.1 hypothetical protein [Pyxidicoccus fallax]NPC83573.1 hypothetical protein [Pyxidicoccus fallax]